MTAEKGPAPMRRIEYSGSVHDEAEIAAVVEVLRGGPTALRIGRNVRAFEQQVAELFGKRRGVMCNSGSSALYLAIELLGLAPGDEIITSPVTFSTDLAPMMRAGLVPVFVDVEPDTYNLDVTQVEDAIGPRTRAILAPNLAGSMLLPRVRLYSSTDMSESDKLSWLVLGRASEGLGRADSALQQPEINIANDATRPACSML